VTLSNVRGLVQKFFDDRAMTLASLLAWGIVNTLLPLILGLLALVGLVLQDPAQLKAAEEAILSVLPSQVQPAVQEIMDNAVANAGAIGLISLGLVLFNGTNFFVAMEEVFNLVYHVPTRNIVWQRVMALWALIIFGALLAGAALAAGGVLSGSSTVVTELIPFVAFQVLYTILPNRRMRWQAALPGALAAAIAFDVVLRVFPLYIALFGGGFSVYVALGGLLVILFWLYIVGLITVTGAVLNAFVEDPTRSVELSSLSARALTGQLDIPPPASKA